MESYAINLVLPKLQNGTKRNVNSLQLEILLFALILGLLRGMLGRSFLLELPPRARRILKPAVQLFIWVGTTSACAENTDSLVVDVLCAWNYLRVRGEYWSVRSPGGVCMELPPRARRIRMFAAKLRAHAGTTSACAENTIQTELTLGIDGELPPRARRIPDG